MSRITNNMSIQDKWRELGYELIVKDTHILIKYDGMDIFTIHKENIDLSFCRGVSNASLDEVKLLLETMEELNNMNV